MQNYFIHSKTWSEIKHIAFYYNFVNVTKLTIIAYDRQLIRIYALYHTL